MAKGEDVMGRGWMPKGYVFAHGDESRRQIVAFIRRFTREHQIPPTQREIAAGCYFAQSTVRYHLARLEQQGVIAHEPGARRDIRLTKTEAA